MGPSRVALVAWAFVAVTVASCAAVIVASVALVDLSSTELVLYESWMVPVTYGAVAVTSSVVAAIVLARHPRNLAGWCLAVLGVSLAVGQSLIVYADLTLHGGLPGPGGLAAAVSGNLLLAAGINLSLVALLFVFPTGRPLTPAWRRVAVASIAVLAAGVVVQALRPGPVGEFASLANPLAVSGAAAPVVEAAADLFFLAIPVTIVAAVWALVVRFRRSSGVERLQLRWFSYAAGLLGASGAVSLTLAWAGHEAAANAAYLAVMAGSLFVPLAVGIAISRYRLYEIDRVVKRTVVYAAVMAVLASVYGASVVGLSSLARILGAGAAGSSDLVVAASTLLAAAAFRPVLHRVTGAVERRFDRSRYDAARTIEGFGARLREEVDLETLVGDLRDVAVETLRPRSAHVWVPDRPHAPSSSVSTG